MARGPPSTYLFSPTFADEEYARLLETRRQHLRAISLPLLALWVASPLALQTATAQAIEIPYAIDGLLDTLVELSRNEDRNGTYLLFDRGGSSSNESPEVVDLVDELLSDGFVLDSARLPNVSYAECGPYDLPMGNEMVLLSTVGSGLPHHEYRFLITIDTACRVVRIYGAKLSPVP